MAIDDKESQSQSQSQPQPQSQPPVIVSEFGTTPEWARRQAVINMRRDPAKLAAMIAAFGEERIRRDYPEVWWTEDGGDGEGDGEGDGDAK